MDGKLAVIGTGTMGSMILWRASLLSDGIVGFDTRAPASESTAAGGDTRLFRMAYAEGPQFASLLGRSERLWLDLNRETGRAIFDQCGGLTIGGADSRHMSQLLASVRETGAEHETLTHRQLGDRYPQHRLYPEDVGILDPRGGFLRTDAAVLNAVELATSRGAAVVTGTKIDRVVPSGDHVQVWFGDDCWTFERVVISSGAWARDLLPAGLTPELEPRRLQLTWFTARNPAEFAADRFPTFMRESRGISAYGAPTIDGSTVKIAGAVQSHRIDHADQIDHDLNADEIERSNAMAAEIMNGIFPACVRSRAYPDLYSADGQPAIGWVPGMPGVYVATGFTGGGFKMAPAVGETVAQTILGGQPAAALRFADPARFVGRRSGG